MLFSPRERDLVALLHDVLVGVCRQRPHQSKIADLHCVIGGQQNIAGSQVPVEETLLLQVGHAARHLHTNTRMQLHLLYLCFTTCQRQMFYVLPHKTGLTALVTCYFSNYKFSYMSRKSHVYPNLDILDFFSVKLQD